MIFYYIINKRLYLEFFLYDTFLFEKRYLETPDQFYYVRLYPDENLQMWIDAEDSLEIKKSSVNTCF